MLTWTFLPYLFIYTFKKRPNSRINQFTLALR